jgi:hypothetical protein
VTQLRIIDYITEEGERPELCDERQEGMTTSPEQFQL